MALSAPNLHYTLDMGIRSVVRTYQLSLRGRGRYRAEVVKLGWLGKRRRSLPPRSPLVANPFVLLASASSRLMTIYAYGRRWAKVVFWVLTSVVLGQGVITPNIPLSFFFDWNPPGQRYPVPVTAQCEKIHIVWGRGVATGSYWSLLPPSLHIALPRSDYHSRR